MKTNLRSLRKIALGTVVLISATTSAHAIPLIFNSPDFAGNAATRAAWLEALGLNAGQYFIDFESGFTQGQQIGGVTLDGGLVLGDMPGDGTPYGVSVTGLTSQLGTSNPVGVFSASHDNDFLRFDFSAAPVDYVGFLDIDQSGFAKNIFTTAALGSKITFADDSIYVFQAGDTDTTASTGNSAEFFGLIGNDMGQIKYIDLATSGDATWGIDNIEFGSFTVIAARLTTVDETPVATVPESASTAGLLLGLACASGLVRLWRRSNHRS